MQPSLSTAFCERFIIHQKAMDSSSDACDSRHARATAEDPWDQLRDEGFVLWWALSIWELYSMPSPRNQPLAVPFTALSRSFAAQEKSSHPRATAEDP